MQASGPSTIELTMAQGLTTVGWAHGGRLLGSAALGDMLTFFPPFRPYGRIAQLMCTIVRIGRVSGRVLEPRSWPQRGQGTREQKSGFGRMSALSYAARAPRHETFIASAIRRLCYVHLYSGSH